MVVTFCILQLYVGFAGFIENLDVRRQTSDKSVSMPCYIYVMSLVEIGQQAYFGNIEVVKNLRPNAKILGIPVNFYSIRLSCSIR